MEKLLKKRVSFTCALISCALVPYAILLAILLLPVCVYATPIDVNIYTDTTISGGEYGTVNIYDTPPDQTIVTMNGGIISNCILYDTSNLNCYGGNLGGLYITENATAQIFNIDNIGGAELHNNSELHLYDGVFSKGTDIDILMYENSKLHIYGYGLEHTDQYILYTRVLDAITGYWGNGQEFVIILSGPSVDNFSLHEIPEPSTILFFMSAVFFCKVQTYKRF